MKKSDYTNRFYKDAEKAKASGQDIDELKSVMGKLIREEIPLPEKYLDHPLKGKWKNHRDCHIKDDFVLIYRYFKYNEYYEKEDGSKHKYNGGIVFVRCGTHSELNL